MKIAVPTVDSILELDFGFCLFDRCLDRSRSSSESLETHERFTFEGVLPLSARRSSEKLGVTLSLRGIGAWLGERLSSALWNKNEPQCYLRQRALLVNVMAFLVSVHGHTAVSIGRKIRSHTFSRVSGISSVSDWNNKRPT